MAKIRVLIADDERISRETIKSLLEPHANCDLAEDGVEAIEKFLSSIAKNEPYEFVFLDYNMPGLNGLEALERIREIEKSNENHIQVNVVIVGAVSNPKEIREVYNRECDAYILKPARKERLMSMLNSFDVAL